MLGRIAGHTCVVCGNTKVKDSSVTFHRIPKEVERRARWLKVFDIREVIKRRVPEFAHRYYVSIISMVCCRHFPDGDCSKEPSITLGKRFASPQQGNHQRKAAAVCFAYGSARMAPGISSGHGKFQYYLRS